ncbi:Carrier domain-containing protein [Fusarium keratoplasticum]|uniref:Carrier domain-containing protein n=1 Tax=Fusarium keratoplasticum TaxID=1328300 RepID=A0ACC0QF16_9HYPO|nr:Carrier domain-containing protein [Fusarium keratoplasticum]KAI8650790.1 Carrier domain-containing protein [Fusarium keratoplasticum]
MADVEPNYFTCTLGEALKLKQQADGPMQSYKTVIDLIETQARTRPQSPALGFASLDDEESTRNVFPRAVSFHDLCELSKCAERALSRWANSSKDGGLTVGLLCTSSFDFVFTWLGLARSGYSVLLLAPQLEPQGIQHLCETLGVTKIFSDMAHRDRASTVPGIDFLRTLSCQELLGSGLSKEPQRQFGVPTDSELPGTTKVPDIAYIFHTSGTSSGLPKPIPQSQFGVVGALPVFPGENKPATFSTTPLYHGGLADCMRAWTSGAMIWFFPEGQVPITGVNILKAINFARNKDAAPIKYFSSVPYVLQMLAEEARGIQVLKSMDLVGVGGAALPSAVGDKFVEAGVNLLSRMGSAECGFLTCSHRDYAKDKEWQYLRVINDTHLLEFEPRENGLSELVVKPRWPFKVKTNRDDGSYATSDLFEPHPSKPNAWRYHSRADSQITLANGRKFDPSPIEGSILASTNMLKDVLIFGGGRDYAGALLFPVSNKVSQKDIIDSIWPHVNQMNNASQSHSRITKPMLLVVPVRDGEQPLEKSSKGTILRRQAEERYAKEIELSYKLSSSRSAFSQVVDEQLAETVSDCFLRVLGRKPDPDQDLYRQGVDSIACIQIRKLIESNCLSPGMTLPMNVIYDQGTITALVKYLRRVRGGHNLEERNGEETQLRSMRQLAEKYSAFGDIEIKPRIWQGNAVVLTGATGFLGAHILNLLRGDARVNKVYCLLRAECLQSAHERVSKALVDRAMPGLETYEESEANHDKIVCLPCDLSNGDLGLSEEQRQRIMDETAVIIHSAWAVNFNLRLNSFEDQIAATQNLLKLAAVAQAQLIFVSSTAAVSNSTSTPILERISQDPSEASPMGYSRSKWVAERVCESANKQFSSDGDNLATVVRIGQLCSNDVGIWNASEAYPLLLSTARVAGCLPDISHEMLNWLPVEEAAQSVMDIAFSSHVTKPENGESLSATETRVYHVLSPHANPSWSQMLKWVSDGEKELSFQIVPPREWMSRLEEALKEKDGNHPSQVLLGLWKQNYYRDEGHECKVGEPPRSPAFDLSRTQQVSAAMTEVKPLDRERVLKMWKWVCETIKP